MPRKLPNLCQSKYERARSDRGCSGAWLLCGEKERVRSSSPWAGTSRGMSAFDADAWLGDEFEGAAGNTIRLGKSAQEALSKAYKDGDWSELDVPAEDAVLPSEALTDLIKIFTTIYKV